MKNLIILLSMALAACGPQPPLNVEMVHAKYSVSPYHYVRYFAYDFRPLTPVDNGGNCARFAASYMAELSKIGTPSSLHICKLYTGEYHAYVTAEGWALDNRFQHVTTEKELGCIKWLM